MKFVSHESGDTKIKDEKGPVNNLRRFEKRKQFKSIQS